MKAIGSMDQGCAGIPDVGQTAQWHALNQAVKLSPARVLLWEITSVGLFTLAMTFAMLKVLPDPVMPRRVWNCLPLSRPLTSFSMARG